MLCFLALHYSSVLAKTFPQLSEQYDKEVKKFIISS